MVESRPSLVAPRRGQVLEMIKSGAGWDPDFYHVVNERDDQLIEDEILNGAGSSKFVYDFEIAGSKVTGISVIGARHLAAHYGGLHHRLVASIQKVGSLFVFQSFPAPGQTMDVRASTIQDLADEPDYYSVVVEVEDIKTGNKIQMERREQRFEKRRDGSFFERPHYATIAQSKCYRNAILSLIDQAIIMKWKEQQLKLGKNETITVSVLDEKRSAVIQFATKLGLPVSREQVYQLTMDQISGLSQAAHEGKTPAFAQAATALGLIATLTDQSAGEQQQVQPTQQQAAMAADKTASSETAKEEAKPRQTRARQAAKPDTAPSGEQVQAGTTAPTQQVEPTKGAEPAKAEPVVEETKPAAAPAAKKDLF